MSHHKAAPVKNSNTWTQTKEKVITMNAYSQNMLLCQAVLPVNVENSVIKTHPGWLDGMKSWCKSPHYLLPSAGGGFAGSYCDMIRVWHGVEFRATTGNTKCEKCICCLHHTVCCTEIYVPGSWWWAVAVFYIFWFQNQLIECGAFKRVLLVCLWFEWLQ